MTCREYLKAVVDPLYTDEEVETIVREECPSEHIPISSPEYCGKGGGRCDECWNREVPFTDNELKFEHTGEVIGKVKEVTGCFEGLEFKVDRVPSTIKDSGDRTEFATGAVRDMREGKGRCDLMPLHVVAEHLQDSVVYQIAQFQKHNDVTCLYQCLGIFSKNWDDEKTKHTRDEITNQRIASMYLDVSKHFEEGAKKYGENNWQKGIPVHCYIDSAIRHYLKWLRGDKDEPHDRAFVWNIMCCIWEVDYHKEDNNA